MPNNDRDIHLDSFEEGRLLWEFFRDSDYERAKLASWLAWVGPPSKQRRDLALLLYQTREPSRLHTLVRLFIMGHPVDAGIARAVIPEAILRLLEKCGLVAARDDSFVPAALLMPLGNVLTACDKAPTENPRPDLVIGPGRATRTLAHFIVGRKVHSALDLCCGTGIHAMQMTTHCETVVAADLNARALLFAEFSSRLNGIRNMEFVQGDGFAPLEGRCFDLIVSNPPFFMLPSDDLLYRGNPLALDGFVENLVRQAPRYLNEGGLFQMILEWVEIEGQPWQQRLTDWVSESGCDVWLIQDYAQLPTAYSNSKMRTVDQVSDEQDYEMLESWTEYYRRRKVAGMYGGILSMRKRSGRPNCVEIEEAPFHANVPFGELVEAVFDAYDLASDEDALLATRPRLSPHVRLEQMARASDEGWTEPTTQLKLDQGMERAFEVEPQVAAFLSECTGKRSLGELIELFLPGDGPQAAPMRAGCMGVMRRLMRRGFVLKG